MYQLEKMGKNCFYIKAIGKFPPVEAKIFVNDFKEQTKNLKKFCVLVDISDASHLDGRSIIIILDLLKENNKRLEKSAFVIINNPPLDVEIKYLLEKAISPKRKIVTTLDEAKEWLGISDIVIKKD
ncbi:MAG: hypothetical protein KAX33_07775 [Candidatus Lokiarchaeota archaeon]|nr:hypothetical protein [Candidatus Lokiarchaeota archaeon]